ncbi:hypothetical protein [His 1 virus]|uniref:Uncharacterized protein ORF14 n=1 Tax=His1 virus (isolate Australia/Victoria) TaxID=654912 RepID=Y014_HIS1I|nr:hypothetical protein His1V_gp14 [His 1 virus]Q25BI1.1 RecName: Full=Uncharacterized protein ORF14 [His1 virus (isolate Victoria)]AAQ13729.1 hypothetical protein [His 1 virus]
MEYRYYCHSSFRFLKGGDGETGRWQGQFATLDSFSHYRLSLSLLAACSRW